MAIVSIPLAGQAGLVQDISPAELPPSAWSEAVNMRFKNGEALSVGTDADILAVPYQPEWAISVQGSMDEAASWVVACDEKAYSLEGLTLTDITPAGVTPLPQDGLNWSGGVLGTVTILHNSKDQPWAWMSPNPAAKMVLLANWPSGMKAYTVRSFKQYLVALGVTKGSTFYPTMVKWSHPADPGSVPVSWDETDPTKDAGETALAETPGQCVDCVSLRDINIIYKQDSVWGMQYIGGTFIFRFYKIFGDFGMPVRNCAVEYTSGKHFVFTGTDLVVHDGTSMKSVADGKVKKMLQSISSGQLPSCYVVNHPAMGEVWFCFRRGAANVLAADTAIVYNHLEGQCSIRTLPNLRFIGTGRVDPQGDVESLWGTNTKTWATAGLSWAEYGSIPAFQRLLGLGTLKLTWVDGINSMPAGAKLERTYLGFPVRATVPPDMTTRKFVRRIWPRFTGTPGTEIRITLGSAESVAEDITWRPSQTFTIGTSRKVDCTLSGKVFGIRIEGVSGSSWKYAGMDAEISAMGDL